MRGVDDLGCRYLQLDDTSLAYLNDPEQRPHVARSAATPSTSTRPTSPHQPRARGPARRLAVTTHMCRGNFRSSWVAEGGYDFVAEALFGELDVDGFFLEYDDERSGGFEPLRFVPKGKQVVLGLVTTKRRELESKDHSSAASTRPRATSTSTSCACRRSAASPRPSRATTSRRGPEGAKLRLIVETAEEVWS